MHVVFSTFFAYGFIFGFFSLRTEKRPTDISSIDLFLNSPYLVLSLCALALIFMSIVRVMTRSGDNGIMMAVGGNRLGVVLLQTVELWIIHGIGFLLSLILSVFIPIGKSELVSPLDYLSGLGAEAILIGGVSALIAYLYTLVDPYRSIRRGK
ncbi:ABC transporter permease [Leptospira andrefontaineae]|uniref:ABC transporter permease n=2 Tax=Leptospira andrefontaineae TaxID=2484976 RepID=A0A4V3JGE9_9LEPT|nr:ABC transporter permease [Leptospira andrefontaineae]